MVVGVELLPRLHDLAEGVVVALAHHDHVEVRRVRAVQPRALLQVLHHVLQGKYDNGEEFSGGRQGDQKI